MNILFVCHRLPFPPNRGGKIRPFNMIRHLSQQHSVVVASLAHSERELHEGASLKDYCAEVIAEVVPPSRRWLRTLGALWTSTPSSVAYFYSPQLHARIRERASRSHFDAVLVHCAFVAQYVLDIKAGLRIMDFGDLDSGKWSEYAKWKSFPAAQMYAFEGAKLRAYEQTIARSFDRCTVTTQGELEEYESLNVPTPCTVIPNGVDTSYFSSAASSGTKPVIVFLGRMDYFPNIDAACYFAEAILPSIRRSMKNVEFRIVGADPVRKVRDLSKIPNVIVTGYVPDVREYVRDATVSVAPLRIARGTQNKILECMAMGIPVVATPQAAKGIQAVAGRDLLVANEPEDFAQNVFRLLNSDTLRRNLAAAARGQVERAHLWQASLRILDATLADASLKLSGPMFAS